LANLTMALPPGVNDPAGNFTMPTAMPLIGDSENIVIGNDTFAFTVKELHALLVENASSILPLTPFFMGCTHFCTTNLEIY